MPSGGVRSIDLHGLRVQEALGLVEDLLNRAVLDDCDEIQIVHGIGRGRIKEALHDYLRGLHVVKSYKLDPANPGVTRVYL